MIPELASIPETVQRETSFALTLGAALLGASAGTLFFHHQGVPLLMLLGVGVTAWLASLPGGDMASLAVRCGIGLATCLCLGLGLVAGSRSVDLALFWLVILLPMLAPTTAVMVVALLSLMGQLAPLELAHSHEDGSLARVSASRWLLLVSLFSGLVAALTAELALGVAAVFVALIAAVRWALGRDAVTTGRQWVQHVRDGGALGWTVVDASLLDASLLDASESARLRPAVRGAPMDGLLVREGPAGPYRGGLGGVPVALVPLGEWREAGAKWRSPGPDVAHTLALLWALSVPFGGLLLAASLIPAAPLPTLAMSFAISAPFVVGAGLLSKRRRRRVWGFGIAGYVLSGAWMLTVLSFAIE